MFLKIIVFLSKLCNNPFKVCLISIIMINYSTFLNEREIIDYLERITPYLKKDLEMLEEAKKVSPETWRLEIEF